LVALQFFGKDASQHVRFAVANHASGAVQSRQMSPSFITLERHGQVPGGDEIAGIKVEVGRLAQRAQGMGTRFGQTAVQVVCVKDP